MLTSYYTIRYLASTLHSTLPGSTLSEAFSQEKDQVVLVFDGEQRHPLVVSCRADSPTCYLHPSFARARRNTVSVLRHVTGAEVASVSVVPGDRILLIRCADGSTIVLLLFGPKANVFHVNTVGRIEEAFRTPREYRDKPFAPDGHEPVYDFPLLEARLKQGPSGPLVTVLKSMFPQLGATAVREILFRANLEVSAMTAAVSDRDFTAIARAVRSTLQDLDTPRPRLYTATDGLPVLFSLIPLQHASEYREDPVPNVHDAIRLFVTRREQTRGLNEVKTRYLTQIRREQEKARTSLVASANETKIAARAETEELFGTLLLAQPPTRGRKSITLESEHGPVTIPLKPSLSTVQNAQEYFDRARRARLALERAELRLPSLRTRSDAADALADLVETAHTRSELDAMVKAHADQFDAFGLGPKSIARSEIPFRIFTVDGGFEVWAGKSSANNDLLTLKYAKPNDLWFHARGSSGSHVVLRTGTGKGEPGKRACEQAAAIAAYYSRMKTAGTVPVAMTLRKYVRKPKGSPPGTVTIERERVLFVAPALPGPVASSGQT